MVATAITLLSPGLRAGEVCAPNDPCTCSNCRSELDDILYECQPGIYCGITICVGGANASIAANSECISCCGNQTQSWNSAGYCEIASPVRQKGAAQAHAADPSLVFVRGCDGNYSLIRLGAAT